MKVEETIYFELNNGKTIFVKDLDKNLQSNVKLLDKLRQDVFDRHYDLQVYMTALEVKKNEIQSALEKMLKDEDNKEPTDTGVSQE